MYQVSDLKIMVIGPPCTGKTSFVNMWTKNIFPEAYKATIVSEFGFRMYDFKGRKFRIQLWDIGGQDKTCAVAKIFAKDSHGCLVVSDVNDVNTIQKTLQWKNTVNEVAKFMDGQDLPCVLVENKIDLYNDNIMDMERNAKRFAQENGYVDVFLTSVKNKQNVDESMECLINNILERMDQFAKSGGNTSSVRDSLKLDDDKKSSKRKRKNDEDTGCC
jgi:small GTP-binding protein